jgi:hypothetical protein
VNHGVLEGFIFNSFYGNISETFNVQDNVLPHDGPNGISGHIRIGESYSLSTSSFPHQ